MINPIDSEITGIFCNNCGFDLDHEPEVCPECGSGEITNLFGVFGSEIDE